MKHIYNCSKKRTVENIINTINSSNIFTTNIPTIKLHNKVPNKEYNNSPMSKVYITLDDIKEHSINPSKVEYRLKQEEELKKVYTQKCSEYKTNIEITDKLNLPSSYNKKAEIINNYFFSKLTNIECKCIYNKIEKFSDDYFMYQNFISEKGNIKYIITIGLRTREYKDNSIIEYCGITSAFYIYIIKRDKEHFQNHLEMYLQDKFRINLYLYM